MEENNPIPNLKVQVNPNITDNSTSDNGETSLTVSKTSVKKEPTELEIMKADMAEMAVEAILGDPKTQDMLKMARPLVKPAVKQLVKELGEDDVRFMLYRDTETKAIVFQRLPTNTIKEFVFDEPEEKDLFVVQESEIENIENLIKKLLTRFAPKMIGI